MSRPLVDFVHVEDEPPVIQGIALTDADGTAFTDGQLSVRILNTDPDTDAKSMVVQSPGRLRLAPGHWSCDLEILMLEGVLFLGGERVERYGYFFVPAGVAVGELSVGNGGARALVFTSGPARHTAATQDVLGAPRRRLVAPVHAADLDWERPKTQDFPAGAGRKTLRDDPETGEGFWLLGVLPHWTSPQTEWHTFAEENYILEGEIQTAVGVMTAGAYLSHPSGEHTMHGPMRSRTGSLLITRAIGPMGNSYGPTDHELEGPWR